MRTCPKCGSRMDQGYLLDNGESGSRHVVSWVEGTPEKSFWTGLTLKGRARFPVVTLRCVRCGFLEAYAPPVQQ